MRTGGRGVSGVVGCCSCQLATVQGCSKLERPTIPTRRPSVAATPQKRLPLPPPCESWWSRHSRGRVLDLGARLGPRPPNETVAARAACAASRPRPKRAAASTHHSEATPCDRVALVQYRGGRDGRRRGGWAVDNRAAACWRRGHVGHPRRSSRCRICGRHSTSPAVIVRYVDVCVR
jgi:hypothetical protein